MRTCASCDHLVRDAHDDRAGECDRFGIVGVPSSHAGDPVAIIPSSDGRTGLRIFEPLSFGCLLHEGGVTT